MDIPWIDWRNCQPWRAKIVCFSDHANVPKFEIIKMNEICIVRENQPFLREIRMSTGIEMCAVIFALTFWLDLEDVGFLK